MKKFVFVSGEMEEDAHYYPSYFDRYVKEEDLPKLVGYQSQDREGNWKSFMNDKHYEDTLADGTWPIRPIYA